MEKNWAEELPIAITVTNKEGKIIYMNNRSSEVFSKYGGKNLIGSQLDHCHNAHSQQIIAQIIANKETNAYTILKNGEKKLIYQCPWYDEGEYAGLVELSLVLPEELPHFVRS